MAEHALASRRTLGRAGDAARAVRASRRGLDLAGPASNPVAQLCRSLGQRPDVVQLASLSAALQRRSVADPVVQRAGVEEEEVMQSKADPNRTGLPDQLKTGVESLSGVDLSGVRVHANSPDPASLDALAFTRGNDIHVAPGQEQHLPHEAWHVVQQQQGRVKATTQLRGVDLNDDHGLEAEADQMGKRALEVKPDTA
jgi:hypothetical protein